MVKVVWLIFPAGIFPVSQTPVSLVEVWAIDELLFQVTVVLRGTTSDDGLKALPANETVYWPPPVFDDEPLL